MTQEQNEPKQHDAGAQEGADSEERATSAPEDTLEDGEEGEEGEEGEDGVDLSDLDGPGGMDRALDAIRSRGDEPSEEELKSIRRTSGGLRRNPWLAAVVMVLGLGVMWSMWADFRYWLRRAPEDLGPASALYDDDGRFRESYDNRWVKLTGTPDVQHAARIEFKDHVYGYVRLKEGGGSLFAMVPREAQRRDDQFEGVFEGRMRRLDRSRHYEEARAFFDGERITTSVDLDADAFLAQLGSAGAGGLVDGGKLPLAEGGQLRADGDDLVRIVVDGRLAKLQLGVGTWKSDAEADAAVASLGFPWTRIAGPTGSSRDPDEPGAKLRRTLYRTYLVAAPEDARAALPGRLDAAAGVETGGADPKVGSAVLPQSYTYVSPLGELAVADGELLVPHDGATTPSPHDLSGGEIAERTHGDGLLALDPAEISAVRLEQQVEVDPHGYVVLVEETPDQHVKWALLFLVVSVVVGLNAAALVIRLRRRARA